MPRSLRARAVLLSWLALSWSAQTGSGTAAVPSLFEDVLVADGLDRPTAMTFHPDGRLFVCEQRGVVSVVGPDGVSPTPYFSLAVNDSGEGGLLNLAFDPDFAENGFFFVYYTRPDAPFNRLSRFRAPSPASDLAEGAEERVLLDEIPAAKFHNGGALLLAPDGTLLLSTGDAERPEESPSLGSLSGKLLRIHRDGRVPADNPYVDRVEARDRIWASGFRNPFGAARDPETGAVYVNDVGRASYEEIDHAAPGADYGWPRCEGPCEAGVGEQLEGPLFSYRHSKGCAITAGVFYRAEQFPPEYRGSYYFADFCGGWIWRLTPEHERLDFAADLAGGVVDLEVGPEGALHYLDFDAGEVHAIRFFGSGNRAPLAAASADPASGPEPLLTTLSGEESSDPDGDPLTYSWSFDDGTPDAEGPIAVHSYPRAGTYRPRLSVSDPSGATAEDEVEIRVGNPPLAQIELPPEGARFRWEQEMRYAGSASDPEDGPLEGPALAWEVVLHHHTEQDPNHHTHPFLRGLTGAEGSFRLPGEHSAGDFVWFRVHLRATDSDGLVSEATRDLLPEPDGS